MNDAAFLAALESCTLPADEFGHAGHVRAGYLYLRTMEYGAALVKIRSSIRNYAASLGKEERYHETITVAFVSLIHERLAARGDGGGWIGFAGANGDLLSARTLLQFYSEAQLGCELARRIFILPRPERAP